MKFKCLIIAFLAFFATGCEEKEDNSQIQTEFKNNYDAPFTLILSNGDAIYMQRNENGFEIDKNDKSTIFIFFTQWCKACESQMKYLSKFGQIYENELRIIGVLMEDTSQEDAAKFVVESNLGFEVAYGQSNYFFAKALGDVEAMPYMIMFDKNGKIIRNYVGMVPPEMLESDIKKAVF